MAFQILIADDHHLILEGYINILNKFEAFEIITCKDCVSCTKMITNHRFDFAFIDVLMPAWKEGNINNGADVAKMCRDISPNTKVVLITSVSDKLLIYEFFKSVYPDGFLHKSECTPTDIERCFHTILEGELYIGEMIKAALEKIKKNAILLDIYNRQILMLLNQGIKTKSLPDHLPLSKSAIDKRKAILKISFNIEKGNDEDLLRAARKEGIIA